MELILKRVVIIGGGYGGVYAIQELSKNKNISITLIDKHTYHHLQPEVYDFIANKSNIADVTIDLFSLCAGFDHPDLSFKNLRVTDINFDKQNIYTEENETLEYDYLIIAAGSRTNFPKGIEGLKNTDDLKKLHRAMFFKQSFENALFNKIMDEGKKCDNTHIAVIGAGLSGVEIAAEMAYYAHKFFKRGSFACERMKITLVSSRDTVLPGLHPKLIKMSEKRLTKLGVNVITNTHMSSLDKEYLYLDNKNQIRYSFVIFAGGIEAARISETFKNLTKNKRGQIVVNEYLQTNEYKNVFAIGDIAEIRNKNGEIQPPNVTIARESGKGASRNILRMIDGKEPLVCDPKLEGTLIALGGYYAACDLYGKVQISGLLGYIIKHFVFLRYKVPLLKYIHKGYEKRKNNK